MEQNNDSTSSIYYQSPMILSNEKDPSVFLQLDQQFYLSSLISQASNAAFFTTNSINQEQSTDTAYESNNELLNELDERFFAADSLIEHEFQAEYDQNNELAFYKFQLAFNKKLITELQTKCDDKNKQLKSNANEIIRLKKQLTSKNKKLTEGMCLIDPLVISCECKDKQLKSDANTIKMLQMQHDAKNEQISKLQKDIQRKWTQLDYAKILVWFLIALILILIAALIFNHRSLNQVKNVEVALRTENKHLMVKLAQKESDTVLSLFLQEAVCNFYLHEYQKTIDATNSVLHYQPNNLKALRYRAEANLKLKNNADAQQDLKNILRLDPGYQYARKLLFDVQKHVKRWFFF